ncbi:hypothetical protein BV22DRAFT_76784 [Leucogyrophana mollusca]|uniref:Uncharacterized protein n=1 Tax=Leucogyrophana mollusca TaxID=85980 RepID=A0ACB8BY10_9AGAM|nr:hypothetical protein BV22DRAFT_76784 [Leucogyrophana mollusca]
MDSDSVHEYDLIQFANYVNMAASAAVVYDQVLAFSQEVDLIWKRRWNLTTALYLVARYSGSVSILLVTAWTLRLNWGYIVNTNILITANWAINIFITAMDAILLMRAYALCNRSKPVLVFLLACFFCQTAAVVSITGMEYNVPNIRPAVVVVGGAIGSVIQDIKIDKSVLVPPPVTGVAVQLAFDLVVFMFALFAFTKHILEARRLVGRWEVSPLLKLLIKDQILYFVWCVSSQFITPFAAFIDCGITSYVVWQALDIPAAAPSVSPPLTFITLFEALDALVIIAGPRMVINLRAEESEAIEGSYQTELSTINFDARDLETRMIGDGEPGPEVVGLDRPRAWRETVEVGV